MGDKQSRLTGEPEKEASGEEVPSDGEILAKLLQSLSQCPGQSLPLATILSRLPDSIRSQTDAEGVCTWLHRYGLFEVSGPKGDERVMLTVGMLPQAEKPPRPAPAPVPAPTVASMQTAPAAPAPAPPGPISQGVMVPPGPAGPQGGGISEDTEQLERPEKFEMRGYANSKEANAVVGDEDNLNPASVQLRGLPFRATIADVMNFLGDHARFLSPVRDNIRLLSNRDGRPSGFARVFFVSPQAAHKCRDALHKRQLLGCRVGKHSKSLHGLPSELRAAKDGGPLH